MPVKSYKLGPGSLELGPELTELVVSAQVRSMLVRAAERVTRVEAVPVLSGEELEGSETVDHDYTLVGNVIQDIDVDGFTDWSWDNKGLPMAFRFTPSTAKGRTCVGIVVPVPLDFGGDVDGTSRPEAAISWRIPEEPILGTVV